MLDSDYAKLLENIEDLKDILTKIDVGVIFILLVLSSICLIMLFRYIDKTQELKKKNDEKFTRKIVQEELKK